MGAKYYHTDRHCGDLKNPLYVTLEKALNYGYEPCPDCAALGGRKVYGFANSPYYHIESNCENGDYVTGTLDQALANGYTACPVCITGNVSGGNTGNGGYEGDFENVPGGSGSSNGGEGEDYSAPASTEVYVDLTGSSNAFVYHAGKRCSDMGMTSGTMVTLEYAIDHGYSDCGYCNPPTHVEE